MLPRPLGTLSWDVAGEYFSRSVPTVVEFPSVLDDLELDMVTNG
jgi:hypothetical protein